MAVMTWVNHASYVLEHGGTRVICDPWLRGTAFDDGWAHLSPSADVDWSTITHVWISHEHPDHFAPRDLGDVPEELRPGITVLYQATSDHKVLEWCRRKGFRTQEAPAGSIDLGSGVRVQIRSWTGGDSYAMFDVDGVRVLNVNDCVIQDDDAARIAAELGIDSVDVLLSQFSYADWNGNPDQPERRRQAGAEKLQRLADQVRLLRPRTVVPFASFVWFCHEENRWMNDEAVTVGRAAGHLTSLGVDVAVLYPGDVWDLAGPWSGTDRAIERYDTDLAAVAQRPSTTSASVAADELVALGRSFVSALVDHNGAWALRFLVGTRLLQRTTIRVTDHDATYALSLRGLERGTPGDPADIAVSSEALAFCLRHLYGGNTVRVSGRLTVPAGGSLERFMRWMDIANQNNKGASVRTSVPRLVQKRGRSALRRLRHARRPSA